MDANQTRIHLVLGRDWRAVRDAAPGTDDEPVVQVDDDGFLHLRRLVPAIRAHVSDSPASPALRRGAARDRQGNFYVVDGAAIRLRCCPSPVGAHADGESFWSGSGALRGLAITTDDLLVAGSDAPGGGTLLLFDLKVGGPPRALSTSFVPLDLAACGPDVWVLAPDRVYRLRITCPQPAQPADAGGSDGRMHPCTPPPPPGLSASLDVDFDLPADIEPLAVDVIAPADAVVLSAEFLLRFRDRHEIARRSLPTLVDPPGGTPPVGHDLAVRGEIVAVVEAQGNQAFTFDARGDGLAHRAEFISLYGYLGRDLVVGDGEIWYSSGQRWVPLVAMPRPRYQKCARVRLPVFPATLDSPEQRCWDSGQPGCVWHRVILDASIPAGSTITVYSRAADSLEAFAEPDAGWRREPPLHRRAEGSELPFSTPFPRMATWDVLLQGAVGRYLELRLKLRSDGRVTPRVAALRAYYPRFSYLEHYLPAVWRDDPVSADFVARFLANPEGIFTGIEDRIAAVHRLFDPARVDPEFLPWLARWFGATLDDAWTEAQQRFFLRHAPALFAWRGTARGVAAAVRLALDPAPRDALFEDAPGGVHLAESFLKRPRLGRLPRAQLEAGALDPAVRWDPVFGADSLHVRWATFISNPDVEVDACPVDHPHTGRATVISTREPSAVREDVGPFPASSLTAGDPSRWKEFCAAQLRFEPSATGADGPRFRRFLERRYGANLTTIWPDLPTASPTAPLFAALPGDGPRLDDWYDFESLILPIVRHAHRFTVVLPTPPRARLLADPGYPERLRALVRRVVELEKPAHTTFDVVFAEHHFRPGEVQLGRDTLLGEPERGGASTFLLDRDVLGEAGLGAVFPVRPPSTDGIFAGPLPLEVS